MAKAKVCSLCQKEYKGAACPTCTETGVDVGKVLESEKAKMEKNEAVPTAFLVDLVSNRKIPITTPRCRVGRDDLNDIVISGDQSISRFHFIITYENGQYQVQDAKSRHGTFLNGNQIGGPEPINDGDVLKIGVSLFWFVIESQAGKDEPLPPVDVEKGAGVEELSLKKGGDYAYSGETELSATQEISIISPEALAQFGLTKKAEEEEEAAISEAEPTDNDKGESKKEDEKESEEKKDAEVKKDSESSAEVENKKESKKDKNGKNKNRDEDEKPAVEPTSEEESEAKSEKPEDGVAVKDLLEPLQDEIEASREMIRDALKKADISGSSESEDEKEDEKAEEDEKSEEKEESASSKDEDEDDEKEDEVKEEEKPESKDDEDDKVEEKEEEEPKSETDENKDEPESTSKKDKSPDEKSAEAETLEKIAEIIDDSSGKSDLAEKGDESPGVSVDRIETSLVSDHDKATNGLNEDMTTVSQMGPAQVPDWCKKYFSEELKHLNKELDTLNEQIKSYQDKIRKIENQAALTKGIRNTLLVAEGDDLIEACKKVLGLAGWKVTQSEEDKHEFLLEHEDEKVLIARVISIKGSAERSHLGQLSISQTRFWCEKGIEPKGVLIVGRVSDKAPKDRGDDSNSEVAEYANMKNVCLMNTLQLLALYRDIALKDGKGSELRSSIHESKGWLKGFDIEPGDDITDDEEKESSKSKSLSSLLSA